MDLLRPSSSLTASTSSCVACSPATSLAESRRISRNQADKEKYKCNNNNQCGDRTHNTLQYIFWHIVSPTFMLILQVQSHGSLPAFLFVRNRRPLLMEGRRGLFHILVSVCRYSAAILAFLIPMLPSPNRYTPVMLLLVAQMFLSLAMQSSGRSFHTISCTSP